MSDINFKTEIVGSLEESCQRVIEALQQEGFGILNRIDLHTKLKEKLGKTLPPTVILGACNPQLAYDAFLLNSDVASLLPCNAVIREVGPNRISIELARPTAMMKLLGDQKLIQLMQHADDLLGRVIQRFENEKAA